MTDDKPVENKTTNGKNIALVIISIALVLTAILYFVAPYKGNVEDVQNCSTLERQAYLTGAEYGMNYSINSLLYYAQNCQIVNVNYTNTVYGFIDVSCLANRTK